jgi:hypothetical protein
MSSYFYLYLKSESEVDYTQKVIILNSIIKMEENH